MMWTMLLNGSACLTRPWHLTRLQQNYMHRSRIELVLARNLLRSQRLPDFTKLKACSSCIKLCMRVGVLTARVQHLASLLLSLHLTKVLLLHQRKYQIQWHWFPCKITMSSGDTNSSVTGANFPARGGQPNHEICAPIAPANPSVTRTTRPRILCFDCPGLRMGSQITRSVVW